MAILKKKIFWYGNGGSASAVELTDIISITVRKGLDTKSNQTVIKLLNPLNYYDGTYNIHKWVDESTRTLKIKKDDVIEVYAKHCENNEEIDTTSEADLLTTCDVVDVDVLLSTKKTEITLTCMDKTFLMLNKVWTEAYVESEGLTAPLIIQNVIRSICESAETGSVKAFGRTPDDTTGTLHTDGNGMYDIDARLVSEGGFIDDTRSDASAFPIVSAGKIFKPVYEWIDELSQPKFTNTESEIQNKTEVAPLKYIFWIDKKNRFHWKYPDNTNDYELIIGEITDDGFVRDLKLKNSVFDIVNCVFFNAGEDIENLSVIDFFYNDTTDEPKLKIKYIPYKYITVDLKQQESRLPEGSPNITIGEDGVVTINNSSGTTHWGEAYSTEADYKEKFYNRANLLAKNNAEAYTKQRANPRYKGSMSITGYSGYVAGEVVKITAIPVGISEKNIRIKKITHQLNKSSWVTTLDLEEDEKALEG